MMHLLTIISIVSVEQQIVQALGYTELVVTASIQLVLFLAAVITAYKVAIRDKIEKRLLQFELSSIATIKSDTANNIKAISDTTTKSIEEVNKKLAENNGRQEKRMEAIKQSIEKDIDAFRDNVAAERIETDAAYNELLHMVQSTQQEVASLGKSAAAHTESLDWVKGALKRIEEKI